MLLSLLGLAALLAPLQQDALTEKDLRNAFKKSISNRNPQVRADAINEYSFATRDLPDGGGAEKIVAKTIKNELDDDEFVVQAAAIVALSWGRHVDTVIDGMEDVLDDLRNMAEKYATRSKEEDREVYREAIQLYERAAWVVSVHPDDRSVDILIDQLRQVEPGSPSQKLIADMLDALAPALLRLGSHEAVQIVVRWTNVFGGSALSDNTDGRNYTLGARNLHDALSDFAIEIGQRGPLFSNRYDNDWREWFDTVEDKLEKQLGKLDEPIGPPPVMDPEAMEERSSDGRERP